MLISPAGLAVAEREVNIVEDDGDVRGAVCAMFGDGDSHVRYALGEDGQIWLLGIYSDGDISGREIVMWLHSAYGRPITVAEAAMPAVGFWEKMQAEGLVASWTSDEFVGPAVPMVAVGPRADAGVGPAILAYHATTSPEDFDTFAYTEDVGYHFGSKETANMRLEQICDSDDEEVLEHARVLPCWLRINKSLRLYDCYTWEPRDTMLALQKAGILVGEEFEALWNDGYLDQEMFREIVERAGYDSVVYANETEGGGDSYMVLDPDRIRFALSGSSPAPARCSSPGF